MTDNFVQTNKKSFSRQRKRLIEQAYNLSENRNYQMPRQILDGQISSLSDIPNVYDLYTQNETNRQANLLPLKQLIVLNSKQNANSTNLTKKGTITQIDAQPTRDYSRRSRIHCTINKNSSRIGMKSVTKRSWWCCLKDEKLEQFQTKQLAMKDDWRQSKFQSSMLLTENYQSKWYNQFPTQ